MSLHPSKQGLTRNRFDAVLFDLDGVLTATAKAHAACWKEMFDAFLRDWSEAKHVSFQPFDIQSDYELYVDGKPRMDGVRSFLKSRGIQLPEGGEGDPPDAMTVWSLASRKDHLFAELLRTKGVEVYPGSVELARALRHDGVKLAVVSSSHHCRNVLQAAGILDLFDAIVDGIVAEREHLVGKPAPDTYLEAAKQLGADHKRAVVIEDAISGVQSGRNGGFGLVVGVDRKGDADKLRQNGADIVVTDLAELIAQ
jgi:beta-phosphoglucomutase family hydrolase